MGSTGSAEGSQLHQKVQKRDAIHKCWKGMNLLTRMGWQRPQAFSREENMALPVINAKTAALLWVQGVSFTVSHTNIEIKPILEHSQQEEHGQVCKCAPPLSRAGNTFPVFVPTSKNLHRSVWIVSSAVLQLLPWFMCFWRSPRG